MYDEFRQGLETMMSKYSTMWDENLGRVSVTKHRIQLPKETAPIHLHFYRAGPRQRQLESDEVDKMLKENIAEATTTEWASIFVFAPKMDGSLRFCVD